MNFQKIFQKRQTFTFIGLTASGLLLSAGCGKDDQSAGDQAKAVTDSIVKKADDVKAAVVGKEETRVEVETRLAKKAEDLNAKINEIETQANQDATAEIKSARKSRTEQLKTSYADGNNRLSDLKKSADADWKVKRAETEASFDRIQTKVNSAVDRRKLEDEVEAKLTKMNLKIASLKDQAARAATDEKKKLDEQREKLEPRYEELKAEKNKFQASTEEKWDTFKEKFSKSFKEAADSFKGLFDQ